VHVPSWGEPLYTETALYTVVYGGGSEKAQIIIDQERLRAYGADDWVYIGEYDFAREDYVYLSSHTQADNPPTAVIPTPSPSPTPPQHSPYVVADAVWFAPITDDPTPTAGVRRYTENCVDSSEETWYPFQATTPREENHVSQTKSYAFQV
jgi:hypothetical protein